VHNGYTPHFRRLVDFIFSHELKLRRLIPKVTFSFSTTDGLLVLYFALVRSTLECASLLRSL
jgi:hypothetical protein